MPNDCWNCITITGSKEEIDRFVKEEFIDETGDPIPSWALKIRHRGPQGILFKLWSGWHPDFQWLEGLLEKYPSFWMKNEWSEEGGMEGVWVGTWKDGEKDIQSHKWLGLSLEDSYYRFYDTEPVCKPYYVRLDENKEQISGRFLELDCLMRTQDEDRKGKFWAIRIQDIGFEKVEEFPSLDDTSVRKAFRLEPKGFQDPPIDTHPPFTL